MSNMLFEKLPNEVREEVKKWLKIYDKANVIFENGAYHVSSCISLKATYSADHKFLGTYKACDIFTEDERIINYIESFHEYPISYKGKRDYKMLHEIEGKCDLKFAFDNEHNLVIAE